MADEAKTPAANESTEGKPKRRFKLPFFSRKKKEQSAAGNEVESTPEIQADAAPSIEETEPLTPQEVVNDLDGAIEVLTKTKAELLEDEMQEQIEKAQKEMVTIKLKKGRFIFLSGVAIVTMWLVVGTQFVFMNYIQPGKLKLPALPFIGGDSADESAEASASASEASASASIKVRIKNSSGDELAANELADIVKGFEYDLVEVVADGEAAQGVTVAVKPGLEATQGELVQTLGQTYKVASSSASLTEDSDFDILILFGIDNK